LCRYRRLDQSRPRQPVTARPASRAAGSPANAHSAWLAAADHPYRGGFRPGGPPLHHIGDRILPARWCAQCTGLAVSPILESPLVWAVPVAIVLGHRACNRSAALGLALLAWVMVFKQRRDMARPAQLRTRVSLARWQLSPATPTPRRTDTIVHVRRRIVLRVACARGVHSGVCGGSTARDARRERRICLPHLRQIPHLRWALPPNRRGRAIVAPTAAGMGHHRIVHLPNDDVHFSLSGLFPGMTRLWHVDMTYSYYNGHGFYPRREDPVDRGTARQH